MLVLVIDDSKAIRLILAQILQDIGYHVIDAADGLEALKLLKEHEDVDLILVDWNMPKMNGFEFVLEVRKDPAHNDIRLMMVTTETEMGQVVKALEAGADEYVMKPFTRETIVEKLALMGMPVANQ